MAEIDIVSGFLGAGKTTLIRKLLKEALPGQQVVLIENEFGEIAIDGGFLQDAGIRITEMNSGCICCTLVGDFKKALEEVIAKYSPDRILIEPSGVGKLSDVARAVSAVGTAAKLGGKVTVVDANKCKMYFRNFGEFFEDQVRNADVLVLSRTGSIKEAKLLEATELLKGLNPDAVLITTPWDQLTGKQFLDAMEVSHALDVELVGLDELKSLEPLRRFHGRSLVVPPQLAEQAEDLVKSGNYIEYRVEYPEGGWELDDMAVTLLSLDELDTLPPTLLRRVERVCLVGDTLVDINEGDIWEDWSNGRPTLMLNRWNGDEPTPIAYGQGFTDVMEMLSKLTGLKDLWLYKQPIRSLDGIQNFPELEETQIVLCDDLTDASAAFACPNLRFVRIDNCPITSIQGVQNLRELMNLNINGTKVSDLSPLAECDFSAAREDGGFDLFINNLPVTDYAPLAGIPLNRLDINNVDAERYLELIEGAPLRSFQACDSFMGRTGADANALFADFVRSHPQLEFLNITWNQAITDLSPLLELEELQEVRVSRDMEKAIASLDGQNLRFRLEIEG